MIKRRIYIFLISILYFCSSAISQTVSFVAQHSDEIYSNKPFIIQYIYTGTKNPSDFRGPDFPTNIQVLYGPAQSVSVSRRSINGRVSSNYSITYTYTVLVDKEGTYNIPPATINSESGEDITSSNLKIKVLSNPNKSSSTASSASNNSYAPAAFVPILSKKSVYIYQPVYMFMRIYHLFDEARPSFDKYPIFNGFINELLSDGSSSMGVLGVDKYNGRNYKTITFGKSLLIPTETGTLKVGPVETELSYTIPSNNPDDFFNFGSQVVRKNIASSVATLDVKPLPEKGKPTDFTGLVGDFKATLSTDKKDFKTAEPITFSLNVSGIGYLKPITIPSPKFPKSFDVYDPSSNYNESIQIDGIHCAKNIEYIVVPNEVGQITIPSLDISYFDPNTSEYKIAKTEPIVMNIAQGVNVSNHTVVSSTNKSVLIDKLLPNSRDIGRELSLFHSYIYWLIYIIVSIIGFISYILIIKYRKDREDIVSFNASRAKSIARKRLRLALRYAQETKKDEFYEEIMKSLWQYASYKLKISSGDINIEKAVNGFLSKGLTKEDCDEFVDLIQLSEAARFSGVQTQDDLNKVYERSANFIALVENKKIK